MSVTPIEITLGPNPTPLIGLEQILIPVDLSVIIGGALVILRIVRKKPKEPQGPRSEYSKEFNFDF